MYIRHFMATIFLACLCMLTPRLAAAAQEVVNVQFDNATGIVDLQLLRDGNKIVPALHQHYPGGGYAGALNPRS